MKHGTKSAFISVNSGVPVGVGVGVSVGSWEHKVTVVIKVPEFCHHKTYLGVDTSDVADKARYLLAKLCFGRLVSLTDPMVLKNMQITAQSLKSKEHKLYLDL